MTKTLELSVARDLDRPGYWMQTLSGRRFYPLDPRAEDFTLNDVANGLAMTCRFGGQIPVDKFYSVAEHTWHGALYALQVLKKPDLAWAFLHHDDTEGLIGDEVKAIKKALGEAYEAMERPLTVVMEERFFLAGWMAVPENAAAVKSIDNRICAFNEKEHLFPHQLDWRSEAPAGGPLERTKIYCWSPMKARHMWLVMYQQLANILNHPQEEI